MNYIKNSLIFILVFITLARLPELYPFFIPFQLTKVAFALSFLTIFCLPKGHIQKFTASIPFFKYALLFYGMTVLSVPLSVWRSGALDNLIGFTKSIAISFSVALLAANDRVSKFKLAIIGSVGLLAFNMVSSQKTGRLSVSSTYDPNDMALLCVTFLPVILAEFFSGKTVFRFVYLLLSIATLWSSISTESRGGIIALCAQGIFCIFFLKKSRMLMATVLVASVFLVNQFASDTLWERFDLLLNEGDTADYNFTDPSGRLPIWKNGLKIVAENPLLGVGIGQFGTAYFNMDGKIGLTAHNTYLQIAAETGLPGLLLYILIILNAWSLINIMMSSSSKNVAIISFPRLFSLQVSLVGFCTGSFFLSVGYSFISIYLLLFIATEFYSYHMNPQNEEFRVDS